MTNILLKSGVFAAALEAVPADDWGRTWADNRTIMLRMTSKQIKEIIDKMRLPVVVHLNMSFWNKIYNGTFNEKRQLVIRHLEVLASTCQITCLELPYTMNIHCYLERLKEVLAQCKSLTNLNLYNNNLGTIGVTSLLEVLGQCSVLNLAHNCICTEGVMSLVEVLTQCTHLNLCNNNIGTTGLESIEKCKTLTTLTYLNLCYNQINEVKIDRILSQNTALAHLDLSQNYINTVSFGTMTKCFALTDLNLSYNHICAEGATSLTGVLRQCPALTQFNISYNHIGAEGATSLAGALGQCTLLSKLYLASNDIGYDGAERLIEVLTQYSSLTYLTLSGNGIGKDRANNLAEVLGHGVKLMC
jgi:Ran GTPase-activating protein (RanGAP) involved in mRNA processing and transport